MNLLDHLGTLPNSSFIILVIILIAGVIFIDLYDILYFGLFQTKP